MNLVVTRIVFTECHSATLARVKTNVRQLEYVLNKLVISSVEIYVRLKPSGRSRCILAALGTLQCKGPRASILVYSITRVHDQSLELFLSFEVNCAPGKGPSLGPLQSLLQLQPSGTLCNDLQFTTKSE